MPASGAAPGKDVTLDPRRVVGLEGATNFRDLGGYRAVDGRTIRWGMLYRSNALSQLTEADVERLGHLDIRLVCDLRAPDEQVEAPSRLPRTNPPEVLDLGVADHEMVPVPKRVESARAVQSDDADKIIRAYATHPWRYSDQLGALLARLARPASYSVVFHCFAGKDRTGFAAALLLAVLDVPTETIFEDYMLSNELLVDPRLWVRREYLQAALDTIDEVHGGIGAYVRDALGVTDGVCARLSEILLE